MKCPFILLTLMMSSWAFAAEEQRRSYERPLTKEENRFRALDRNNDRRLSTEEFRVDATASTEFALLDQDHDGSLSMSEFISRPIPPATTRPDIDE